MLNQCSKEKNAKFIHRIVQGMHISKGMWLFVHAHVLTYTRIGTYCPEKAVDKCRILYFDIIISTPAFIFESNIHLYVGYAKKSSRVLACIYYLQLKTMLMTFEKLLIEIELDRIRKFKVTLYYWITIIFYIYFHWIHRLNSHSWHYF